MSNLDELEKWAYLKNKKVITLQEFNEQKKRLLNKNLLKFMPQKEAFVYYILAWFFGALGVHNFYIYRIKEAFIQLFTFILATVSFVWVIMDPSFETQIEDDSIFSLPLFIGGVLILCLLTLWVWILVNICTVKVDGKGNLLKPAPRAKIVFIVLYLLFTIVRILGLTELFV